MLILLIPLKLTPHCAVLAGALRGRSFPGFNLHASITCFSVWLAKDLDAMATALCKKAAGTVPHPAVALQPHVECSRPGQAGRAGE